MVPPNVAGRMQIVVAVTFQNGTPVQSRNINFALPNGQAAGGAPPLQLDGTGFFTNWYAFIPYCTLAVQSSIVCVPAPLLPYPVQTNLAAHPVLFIDNFGVAAGPSLPFIVRL